LSYGALRPLASKRQSPGLLIDIRMFHLSHSRVPVAAAMVALSFSGGVQAQTRPSPRVAAIRFWSFGDITRVAIQTEGEYKLTSDQIANPARLYFDLGGLRGPSTLHHGLETIKVGDKRLKQIRIAELSSRRTRIVFDLETPVDVVSSQLVNPDRLIIEIRPKEAGPSGISVSHTVTDSKNIDLPPADTPGNAPVNAPTLISAPSRTELNRPALEGVAVGSGELSSISPPQINTTPRSDSPTPGVTAVINSKINHKRPPSPAGITAPDRGIGIASPARKDSSGDRSLVRVFGLKLGKVVIDPGHGGHDTGTIGPRGLMEKDLVLDIALRLGRLITQQLGAAVVYTRSDDIFIPLEDRTKIANEEKADLFISIHANSSPEPSATGVETYYFNLTADRGALDLATRENATSVSSISDLNDLLHKAVLKTKTDESREFAQKVQTALWGTSVRMNNRSRDRGVRQAPFVVLIGAAMPSILSEIGFVSNPHDEKLLKRNDQRASIANALFKGVSQYANSLSHVQIARAVSN
jgi:N-acetylmuramoyl-L-alanine amidase